MWNIIYDNKYISWYVDVKTLGKVAEAYNYLCPFYCLSGQIILCSPELYSNILIQWADYSIHHLLEINMPNKYFFHLPLMWNVTSLLQAAVRFSLKRAPGFPAIKASESNSTQALSRGRPKKMMPSRQDIPMPCSHPLWALEDPTSSTLSTGKSHGKYFIRNTYHYNPSFPGFPRKMQYMLCHYAKPSTEVSLMYPKYCLTLYPRSCRKTTSCRVKQDREKSKVEAVERFFQMTEFAEITDKRKVT